MNLIETIGKYQNKIMHDGILIEYDIFFEHVFEGNCQFAIDDYTEIKELNNIILEIKNKDKNAKIFVSTYGIDQLDVKSTIYADMLLIDTVIALDLLTNLFQKISILEPSAVVLFEEDETMGEPYLVIFSNGRVEDYKDFIEKRDLSKIKNIYWD